MFRISCFADEISPSIKEQIRVMKELNLHYVELRSIDNKNVLDFTDEEAKAYKKEFEENDIYISSIGSPIGKVDIDSDFDEYLKKFKRSLELAHIFNTKYIRIFSFYHKDKSLDECRCEVMKRLSAMTKLAKEEGIILCHENEANIYGELGDRCMDILETINDPNLRAVIDPSNYVVAHEHPFEQLKKVHQYIEYMHVKDSIFDGEIVPAGKGDGDMKMVVDFLRYHKDMFATLEPHLKYAGSMKGFSGEELFKMAHKALVDLLNELNIEYR